MIWGLLRRISAAAQIALHGAVCETFYVPADVALVAPADSTAGLTVTSDGKFIVPADSTVFSDVGC